MHEKVRYNTDVRTFAGSIQFGLVASGTFATTYHPRAHEGGREGKLSRCDAIVCLVESLER